MDFLAPQQIMAKTMGTFSDPAKYIVWLLTFVHTPISNYICLHEADYLVVWVGGLDN